MANDVTDGGAQADVEATVDEAGVPVIKILGEVDISNVDDVRRAIDPIIDKAPPRVVFDLSALHFMDSSGIALLLEAAARVGAVWLRNPTHIVRRVVNSTGLTEVLPIEP